MRVTIYDVAKKAGVGIGTVSRVLNDSPQIASATRTKVLKAIKDLNYEPHALAQGLARRKSHTIGVIVPFFTGYFYVELLKSIQRAISEFNYDLILYGVDDLQKKEHWFKRVLQQRRVDAVLLVSMRISDKFSKEFKQRHIPLVLVDAFHPAHDSFIVNNEEGAYQAVRHLIQAGHQKIAFINGHLESTPAQERLIGFRRALTEAGIAVALNMEISSESLQEEKVNVNDGFNKDVGYYAMSSLLQKQNGDRPTAVFVASDIQAIGVINAIREKELRIPQDIAVVGFDDVELAELVGLTTMHQPIMEMGRLAIEKLIAQINGEDRTAMIQHRFNTSLIIRDTCGAKLNKTS